MIEVALMDPSKETDNKLRWQADVEGVKFQLYVPKWRVPRPWPMRVLVRVGDVQAGGGPLPKPTTSGVLERPIVAIVEKVAEHTRTVRFAPRGDPKDWELGEPYIPYDWLPSPTIEAIRIEVEWDRSGGTWSDD